MGKWIMLDPSTDGYFIDENRRPLSVLELREKFARQDYAAFTLCEEVETDLQKLWDKNMDNNAYFCKNLFRIGVDRHNGFGGGRGEALWLIPAGCSVKKTILANIAYRLRRYPAGKESFEKWLEKTQKEPEPIPRDSAVFTAPPQ